MLSISLISSVPIFCIEEPVVDLYNQRGGEGPNQPSDGFAPSETVILYAYVTYNDTPVEGKLVAFEVLDASNACVLDRSDDTDVHGVAWVNFTISPVCLPWQFGIWTAISVVSVAEKIVNDTLTFRVSGPVIDLFTQRGGYGSNKFSDAFAPQEEVILYARVSYDCNPLEGKLVAFEVRNPANECVTYRSDTTNASGIAVARFRVPSNATFGIYTAIATVSVVERTVNDTLTFRVGWIVEILKVETVNQFGEPQVSFARDQHIYFNITGQNIAFTSKMATFTVAVCDARDVPIGLVVPYDWLIPKETCFTFIVDILIPKWAYIGVASVYTNAYTELPQNNGTPFCPETSTIFMITKP